MELGPPCSSSDNRAPVRITVFILFLTNSQAATKIRSQGLPSIRSQLLTGNIVLTPSPMEISLLLLIFFLPLISFLFLLLFRPFERPQGLPPGPRPWPVLGNLLQLGRSPHAALARMARDHGPLLSLRLGSETIVVASNPAAAEQVLRVHDRALSGRRVVHTAQVRGYADHSVVWSVDCGDYWRRCRGIFTSDLLGPRMMKAQAGARERKVSEMVGFIKEREGEVVEIREVVFEALLNIFGNIVFSRDLFPWGSPGAGATKALFFRLIELSGVVGIEDYFPLLSKFDALGRRRAAQDIRKKVFESWGGFITQRRGCSADATGAEQDFLASLIDAGLSDPQINALLLDVFAAGTDTSTSTVEWAMAELIKNPKIMEKLCHELGKEIGEATVREFHLPRLHYLLACVKETLRLHPAVPLLLHCAVEPCKVLTYDIPKDCQVMVNVWAIGRDPETWKDPNDFKPDRFMNSIMNHKETSFGFIPFGGGRRICPGMSLADLLVPLILASLVHNFEWRLPNGMNFDHLTMGEKFGLTLKKDPTLLLVPRSRA